MRCSRPPSPTAAVAAVLPHACGGSMPPAYRTPALLLVCLTAARAGTPSPAPTANITTTETVETPSPSTLAPIRGDACPNYAGSSWFNMQSWLSAGVSARWQVQDGGRTVTQYTNTPRPGFYVSDTDDLIDVLVKGTITVSAAAGIRDDDFIGLSVGHKGPLPGDLSTFDTLLFSWGGYDPDANSDYKHDAAVISRVVGDISYKPTDSGHAQGAGGTCFFFRYEYERESATDQAARENDRRSRGCYALKNTPLADDGWQIGTTQSFSVLYTQDEFKVNINGKPKLGITRAELAAWCDAKVPDAGKRAACKAWKAGRIAWYNLSQNGVYYGNVRIFPRPPSQDDAPPVITKDVYTITRKDGQLQPLNVEFYDGIIANDYSPSLYEISIVVDGMPVAGSMTIATAQGGTVVLQSDGGFSYTPPAGVTATTIVVDQFEYSIVDDKGVASVESAVVRFPLPADETATGSAPKRYEVEYAVDEREFTFWDGLERGQLVATVTAFNGCGSITDWRLVDGGAGGRFGLRVPADRLYGAEIFAKDPNRLRPGEFDQVYDITAQATDWFGKTQTAVIRVTVPARTCVPACSEYATCDVDDYKCVCDDEYFPAGECTVFCPGSEWEAATGTCLSLLTPEPSNITTVVPIGVQEEEDVSCAIFEIGGECLGWLVIILVVLCCCFCVVAVYAYNNKGKTTTSTKAKKLQDCEVDIGLLEGLE